MLILSLIMIEIMSKNKSINAPLKTDNNEGSELLTSYQKVEKQLAQVEEQIAKKNPTIKIQNTSSFAEFSNTLTNLIQKIKTVSSNQPYKEYEYKESINSLEELIKKHSHTLEITTPKYDILCINFTLNEDSKVIPLFFYDDSYISNHNLAEGHHTHLDKLLEQLKSKYMPVGSGKTICAVDKKGNHVAPENTKDAYLHFDKQKEICLHFDKQKNLNKKTLFLFAIQEKENVLTEILCPMYTDIKIFSDTSANNSLYTQISKCCEANVILTIHDFELGLSGDSYNATDT